MLVLSQSPRSQHKDTVQGTTIIYHGQMKQKTLDDYLPIGSVHPLLYRNGTNKPCTLCEVKVLAQIRKRSKTTPPVWQLEIVRTRVENCGKVKHPRHSYKMAAWLHIERLYDAVIPSDVSVGMTPLRKKHHMV